MEHRFYSPQTPPTLPQQGYSPQPPTSSPRRRRSRSRGPVPAQPIAPAMPPYSPQPQTPALPPAVVQKRPRKLVKKSRRRDTPPLTHPHDLNGVVKKWTIDILSFAALLGASALMVGGAWISYHLIVHPDAATLLNRLLPEWASLPIENSPSLQTLDQIKASLRAVGLTPATPIALPPSDPTQSNPSSESDILLPIIIERPPNLMLGCETTCQQLVELRVYQYVDIPGHTRTSYYRPISQIPVDGPAESFVIATDDTDKTISNKPLPLTQLTTFTDDLPGNGVWFNLKGKRMQGNQSIPYGYILHYNPTHLHLNIMLEWRSLAGKLPKWQNITGSSEPELIIDQTIGLEPNFEVYQLQPRKFVPNPIELARISLDEPVLKYRAYRDALRLATSGLWSPALSQLQPLSNPEDRPFIAGWSPIAQAQLDVIAFHAKITQTQASGAWASVGQKALVDLIDGRWQAALDLFESDLQNSYAISQLLKTDRGQIWKRIETTLKVEPEHLAAKAWGALLIAIQEDRNAAITWLNEQPKTEESQRVRILEILGKLDTSLTDAEILKEHRSQLIGSVSPVINFEPKQWRQPSDAPPWKPSSYQVWFEIQVASFHDGYQWRQPVSCGSSQPCLSLSNTPDGVDNLWRRLGLHNDSQVTIEVGMMAGQRVTTTATIQGLKVENGALKLLALGNSITGIPIGENLPQPIAFTASALQWLQPQTVTIASLSQSRPEWVTQMLPTLWQELQVAGQLPPGTPPNSPEMLERLGTWLVQMVDLTGDNQAEALLVVEAQGTQGGVPVNVPRTLIFAETGALIYSELSPEAQQFVTGLVNIRNSGPAVLMVDTGTPRQNYTLQKWSGERQQFAPVSF